MPSVVEIGADEVLEVRIFGEINKRDVLDAITKLRVLDPRKERCDLWTFASESILPYVSYEEVLRTISGFCPPDMVGEKTAVVADGMVQQALMEMYQSESTMLPYEIRVFSSQDEARTWLSA